MASIASIAQDFFAACETGKGWEGCQAYCHADASFAAQADPSLPLPLAGEGWGEGFASPF